MRYVDRETGAIVSASWVRDKFKNTRMIPVENRWTQWNYDTYGIDPIEEIPYPEYDKKTHVATKAKLRKKSGKWVSGWDIKPLYKSEDDAKKAVIKSIERLCDSVWKNATVVVDGVPYRTSEKGIALLQTATYYNQKKRNVVSGGTVYERTPEQLREAKIACDNFIQSCFDKAAMLITEVSNSDDPLSIDIRSGWPSGKSA